MEYAVYQRLNIFSVKDIPKPRPPITFPPKPLQPDSPEEPEPPKLQGLAS